MHGALQLKLLAAAYQVRLVILNDKHVQNLQSWRAARLEHATLCW
jgi:hypothetical protein